MARALLVGTGVVATVAGAVLLAGGGAIAATFGTDGRVSTAPASVVGSGVAVLVEGLTVDAAGLPVPDGVGVLTITATAPDGSQVFLGTARDDDLDTYLTGAPYDVVASLSPGTTATTRPVPGTLRPQPPVDADLWVTKAVGAPARLPARVPDGTTLVVMRPDGDQGVAAALVVTLEVDRAWPAALIALGAGLVLLILGLVLLRLGLRRRPSGAHAAGAAPVAVPVAVPVEPVVPEAAVVPVEASGDAAEAGSVSEAPVAEPDADDRPTAEIDAVVDGAPVEGTSPEAGDEPEQVQVPEAIVDDATAAEPLDVPETAVGAEVDAADAAPTDAAGSAG